MSRTFADEAIVLKTYDVGEADRFCILLTRSAGRIAVRAAGVRRATSRRGAALLPLRRIALEYAAGRTGTNSVTQASCIDPYAECARNLPAFSCAEQGMEILMNLIHEGESVEPVYELTREFLSCCSAGKTAGLLPLFTLKLLAMLGAYPDGEDASALPTDTSHLRHTSSALRAYLQAVPAATLSAPPACPAELLPELERYARYLLGSQLGGSLKSPPVASRLSPASTPIR